VIGTQFSSLVKQFVSSFVNPLLSLVGGTPDLGKLVLHVGKATFTYGQFLTEALTFLISALVVYYAMVLPVSRLLKLLDRNEAATSRDCPECTMSIPVAARNAQPRSRRPPNSPASSSRTAAPLARLGNNLPLSGSWAGHGRAHLPDRLGGAACQLLRGRDPDRYRPSVHRGPRLVADQVRGPGS
jgi:large conductance mechanosensitive channel